MADALAEQMPPVQYAQVNGIRMAYYEAGPRGGVPVVLCHGFPELAFSWRHQIKALAKAGRWVIAPDQRGYGLTDRPAPVEAYDMEHLTGDLVGLLDHIGADKGVFVGHDWGGIVVWQMPLRHAARTAGVIGLNTPFMARGPMDPIAIMRQRLGEEMYIVHFQRPGEADAVLDADPAKAMNFFLRRPLPGQVESAGLATERKAGDPPAFALINILKGYDPTFDPREKFLTDDELAVFVETFRRTGFTGGINWYRNFTRNWERSAGIADKVAVPSLMIMAEKDAVLPPSSADGMEAYCTDLEKTLIKDSGHWTQQEKPDAVNAAMIDWLDRRFPK
ncbi:MAG TPA: alpha/beta hydrolase [Caulobacteraceae bacterium]|nr:alpha/beta hydrolase [Caulobacteraceae bacterium]